MKYKNNLSIYLKWLGISAVITLLCVFAGMYITHMLTEQDRARREGPQERYSRIMRDLVETQKFSPEEAFRLVFSNMKDAPFSVYLMDENNNPIDSQIGFERGLDTKRSFELTPNRSLRFSEDKFRRRGPPPGALLIGGISVTLSIIVGIGLSLLFISLYIQRKSREAHEVINRLKQGDLKARFKLDANKESELLMVRFNQMADQIEGLVNELRNTESARTKMLQELAHDLRTPVASLKNLQETLLEKGNEIDQEKRQRIETLALKEVKYFERLVEDLLFLSGVNDPKYGKNLRSENLGRLFREELELYEDLPIVVRLVGETDIFVMGDEHLLQRLVKNVLSNAFRYAQSKIVISFESHENKIAVLVTDDGTGMKEEDLKSFGEKKYSRALVSHQDERISIGLGSVIMKKIMTLHEGKLQVANSDKGGLEVSLSFPR